MAARMNFLAQETATTRPLQGGWQGVGTRLPLRAIGALVYASSFLACGASIPPAEDALREWSGAVERGDCAAMYALLASDIRAQVTDETFEQWCVGQQDAMRAQSDLIARSLSDGASAHVVARVPISAFQQVRVRLVDDRWLLDQPLPLVSGADDPLSAVAELSRVLEGPQADQFLSMMSPDLRASFLGRLHAVRTLLLAGEPASLVVTSDTAEMVIGSMTIHFQLREGVWIIDDLSDSQYSSMYYE
jgi:hypothetical protein